MLNFLVYQDGAAAADLSLDGAYMVGTDYVPVRAELEFKKGELSCRKRAQGAGALSILWSVKGTGRILLQTTRLQERHRPYNLSLELARGQLMRINHKREDWGLFDIENIEELDKNCRNAQELFIEALKTENVAKAARLADEVLSIALPLGEQMALLHASVFLNRRRQAGQLGRRLFGTIANLSTKAELYRKRMRNGFDFITVPVSWRNIEPKQGEFEWTDLDEWIEWLTAQGMPIKASPLVSFHERHVPDWLYIYENDYETTRQFVFEHIRRVVQRYKNRVQVWDCISGIHAHNVFNMNFEQLMDLTRMSSAITKQIAPDAITLIDIVCPWGEYYARNPRSIPPMLYADMIVQNNINFDAFGMQLYVGVAEEGMYVRDMFEISCMLDRFAVLGKPIHITATQVPSAGTPDELDAWSGTESPERGGVWHDTWSEALQSRWLRELFNVALSKPFIDTVTWRDLADVDGHFLPHGGLLRRDFSPKLAYEQLCAIRAQIHGKKQL